jgi:hypothetical protein
MTQAEPSAEPAVSKTTTRGRKYLLVRESGKALDQYRRLFDAAAAEGEEFDPEAIRAVMMAQKDELARYVMAIVEDYLEFKALADGLGDLIKKLQDRKAGFLSQARTCRESIAFALMRLREDGDEDVGIKGPAATVYARPGTLELPDDIDELAVPSEFWVQPPPPPPEIDRKALLDAVRTANQRQGEDGRPQTIAGIELVETSGPSPPGAAIIGQCQRRPRSRWMRS